MVTLTGAHITQEEGLPSLLDIAVGLSAMPRFGGQTIRPITVLDHSLAALALAAKQPGDPFLELHALVHDWHECLTGDIPTPFKTADMRALQARLDDRFFKAHGIPALGGEGKYRLKNIDQTLLTVESFFFSPDAFIAWNYLSWFAVDHSMMMSVGNEYAALLDMTREEKIDTFITSFEGLLPQVVEDELLVATSTVRSLRGTAS